MDGLTTILAAIAAAVGLLWVLGLGASFLAGVCESAKPAPEEGEPPMSNGALGAAGGVASFLTPFILFVHGFWRLIGDNNVVYSTADLIAHAVVRGGVIITLSIILVVVTMGAAIVGWVLARASPGLARGLFKAAPFVGMAAFLFVVSFAYSSVVHVLEAVAGR